MSRTTILMALMGVVCVAVSVANADSTAGSLYVPPEQTGPYTFTYSGSGDASHTWYNWPNYLTGINAGTEWRMEVTGIDMSQVTGGTGRTVYFQLANVGLIGGGTLDTNPNHQWNSLTISLRLDVWGDNLDKDLFQAQETCYRTDTGAGFWNNMRSAGFDAGDLTRDNFDLRMDFHKDQESDPWTVTPSYHLDGGSWTVFDGGTFTTTNSWRFGAPDGEIWPGQGGSMISVAFDHGGVGTVSLDNITIVPEPATMSLLALGGLALIRRRRTA